MAVKPTQNNDYKQNNLSFRQTIISGGLNIPAAVSLTNFEDILYWADLTKMAVMSVSKFEQTEPNVVWQSDVKPLAVKAVHQVLQPKDGRGTVKQIRRLFCENCLFLHKNICCGCSLESPR